MDVVLFVSNSDVSSCAMKMIFALSRDLTKRSMVV
jgi:hypothetical protein